MQIIMQLSSVEALKSIIVHTNGSGVRVGGRNLTVEVRSIHPEASAAGSAAENLVHEGAGSDPGGGQCL